NPELQRHAFETAKARRSDADDRQPDAIDGRRLADHRRVAPKRSLPYIVTQNDHAASARLLAIGWTQRPSERSPNAEHVEVVPAHELPQCGLTSKPGDEVHVRVVVDERSAAVIQLDKLRPGELVPAAIARAPRGIVERVRIAYGGRPQHIGIEQREGRGQEAEPESDRTDDREH